MRPCFHGVINLWYRGVCYKAKPSWPLAVGIPHHLQTTKLNNSSAEQFSVCKLLLLILCLLLLQLLCKIHTTQSVSVPHCSKWARKLSSVVSKLKPPINSFLSCSGSLASRSYAKQEKHTGLRWITIPEITVETWQYWYTTLLCSCIWQNV